MVAERTPDDRPASEAVHVQGDDYVEPPHVQTSLDAVNWAFRHFEGADWSGLPPRQSVPYLDARGYHIDHPSRPLNKGGLYTIVPTPVRDTLAPYTDPQGLATRTARRPGLWNGALCIMLRYRAPHESRPK